MIPLSVCKNQNKKQKQKFLSENQICRVTAVTRWVFRHPNAHVHTLWVSRHPDAHVKALWLFNQVVRVCEADEQVVRGEAAGGRLQATASAAHTLCVSRHPNVHVHTLWVLRHFNAHVQLKKLLGGWISTPYTPFCLICTIKSELIYFPICSTLEWADFDIRCFLVDGFDTRWIPRRFFAGYDDGGAPNRILQQTLYIAATRRKKGRKKATETRWNAFWMNWKNARILLLAPTLFMGATNQT